MTSETAETPDAKSVAREAPLFSVIIVNFNGGTYLSGAVQSLARQTRRDFEVILVDNASSDASLDEIDASELPAFTLVQETENLGFARANNKAAQLARGKWLALLNPDTVAADDWLDQVASGIQRHPDVTSFASLQLDLNHPDRLDGTGDNYLAFGFPWRGGYGQPARDAPAEGECFSACGASAILRRDVFLAHGGFDARLFCYCEDVDLGFRLRLAGERCIFLPNAVVKHAGTGTTSSETAQYLGYRNRIWVYAKNMPWPLLAITLPGHIALTVYLLIRAAMRGTASHMWKSVWHGLKGVPRIRASSPASPPPRQISLQRLAKSMHWNPMHLRLRPVPNAADQDAPGVHEPMRQPASGE